MLAFLKLPLRLAKRFPQIPCTFAQPLLLRASFWRGDAGNHRSCLCTCSATGGRIDRVAFSPHGSQTLLRPCWLTSASALSRGCFPSSLHAMLLSWRLHGHEFLPDTKLNAFGHDAHGKDFSTLIADTLHRSMLSYCSLSTRTSVSGARIASPCFPRPRFKLERSSSVSQVSAKRARTLLIMRSQLLQFLKK